MPNILPASAPALPSRRHALTSLAGLGAALALSKGAHAAPAAILDASGPDLTFALIERHRAAEAAADAIPGEIRGDEPEMLAEEAALAELIEREPTTLAGLRAFAEYFEGYAARPVNDDQTTRWALDTIAEACRRLIAKGGAA